jgi:hypothetical protein
MPIAGIDCNGKMLKLHKEMSKNHMKTIDTLSLLKSAYQPTTRTTTHMHGDSWEGNHDVRIILKKFEENPHWTVTRRDRKGVIV